MVAFEKSSSHSPTSSDLEKNEREIKDVAPDELGEIDTTPTEVSNEDNNDAALRLDKTPAFHFRAVDDDLPQ